MKNFVNNRTVNFEDLEQALNENGERIYSEKLIQKIEKGEYNYLNEELTPADREDRDYMEPLLYAVKNEKNTYIIYKYYGENLQEDLGLLIDVIIDEPEIIENTPISYNKDFILDIVEINPRVIFYMSDTLKLDTEFIEQLSELKDKRIDICVKLVENPSLASNLEFMKEAIKEDAKLLEFASKELKNNYEFIKETSKENYEVIDYVIENKEEFGLEAIKGAKDTTKELTIQDYRAIIDEMSDSSDDNRYKRVKEKMAEKGTNDPRSIRWITAMAAQSDKISPENFKKVFDNAILTMIKTQKDLTEDGKEKVTIDNMQELITPQILRRLQEKAISQGLEIDAQLESRIKEYEEFFYNHREKLKEQKKNNLAKQKSEENVLKIESKNIEELSRGAYLSKIQAETSAIREKIIAEREEKTNEKNELGEKE